MSSTVTRVLLRALVLAPVLTLSLNGCGGGGGGAGDGGGDVDILAGARGFAGTSPDPDIVTFRDRLNVSHAFIAIPGQVLVVAAAGEVEQAESDAVNEGAVVGSVLPFARILLAEIPVGSEAAFITAMLGRASVEDAHPNFLVQPDDCNGDIPAGVQVPDPADATPIPFPTVVAQLDVFTDDVDELGIPSQDGTCTSHGELVHCFLNGHQTGRPALPVTQIHVGERLATVDGLASEYGILFSIARLIQGAKNRPGKAVINVSLGPIEEGEEYGLFLHQLYEMVDLQSQSTRDRLVIVLAAGNHSLDLTQEIADAKSAFPDAARNIVIAGGLDENGARIFNTSQDSDDLIHAPAVDQSCDVDGQTVAASGTSFATPQIAEILGRLASDPRYASLTATDLVKALLDAAPVVSTFRTIPTLPQVESAADALLGGSTYTLSVSVTGPGGGSVTSSPAGIDCGATCSTSFPSGTSVVLTAVPSSGSTFAGWSGPCSGTGSCAVTMSAHQSVTATFTLASVSAFNGTYRGTSTDDGSITVFAFTLTDGVVTSSSIPGVLNAGTVSASGAITGTGFDSGCGIATFSGQLASGGATASGSWSRPAGFNCSQAGTTSTWTAIRQ